MTKTSRAGRAAFVWVALIAAALFLASASAAFHDHATTDASGSSCVLCVAGPTISADAETAPLEWAPLASSPERPVRSGERPSAPAYSLLPSRAPPASLTA